MACELEPVTSSIELGPVEIKKGGGRLGRLSGDTGASPGRRAHNEIERSTAHPAVICQTNGSLLWFSCSLSTTRHAYPPHTPAHVRHGKRTIPIESGNNVRCVKYFGTNTNI
eukprot:1524015-Amphidinium_carterae.1